jgi:hypothetical protein
VVGFGDSAVGQPEAPVVVAAARVLALLPCHLFCATEFVVPT